MTVKCILPFSGLILDVPIAWHPEWAAGHWFQQDHHQLAFYFQVTPGILFESGGVVDTLQAWLLQETGSCRSFFSSESQAFELQKPGKDSHCFSPSWGRRSGQKRKIRRKIAGERFRNYHSKWMARAPGEPGGHRDAAAGMVAGSC